MPQISCVMSVYNAASFLNEAIDSILNQTYSDFEFIIVDDGSTDNSVQIVESYLDLRIRLLKSEKNNGISVARNLGMRAANGKYIAFMDADDISHPERFERQFLFMEKNPEIGVCSARKKYFGDRSGISSNRQNHEEIIIGLLWGCTLVQPLIMLRSNIIKLKNLYYGVSAKYAEDYEFFARLAIHGVKFANLDDVLLMYRWHSSNVSQTYKKIQRQAASKVRLMLLEKLGLKDAESALDTHMLLRSFSNGYDKKKIQLAADWIHQLLHANRIKLFFSDQSFRQHLARRWFLLCYNATHNGFWVWRTYFNHPVSQYYQLSHFMAIKFLLKCLMNSGFRQEVFSKRNFARYQAIKLLQ